VSEGVGSRWHRGLAVAAFALILIGGFESHYIRVLFSDRSAAEEFFRELPYRKLPGYRQLLLDAANLVPEGSRVAFWMPEARWQGGYRYGFERSGYFLAGRQPVPLIDSSDQFREDNLGKSEWIICWRCEVPFPGFETVWRGAAGSVAKRT
jgi:hypothetical protein